MTNLDLVTTAQAVEISGYSRYKLYRLVKAGTLPVAVKSPAATGGYLFTRADIEALRAEVAA